MLQPTTHYIVGSPKPNKYWNHVLKMISWSLLTSVLMQLMAVISVLLTFWLSPNSEKTALFFGQSLKESLFSNAIMISWALVVICLSGLLARKINERFWRNSKNINPALPIFKKRTLLHE